MSAENVRRLLLRAGSLLEQEVRARPRVYRAFYRAVGSSPRLRSWAGRVKERVRAPSSAAEAPQPQDDPVVRARREAATAARLGLRR